MPELKAITVSRLFNTGNYEHLKYEFSVELKEGDSPADTLKSLETAIEGLNPVSPVGDYDLRRARRIVSIKPEDRTVEEAHAADDAERIVACHEEYLAKKESAYETLKQFGACSLTGEATQNG